MYLISQLDLANFPQRYPGINLVGKCFVGPRGADFECPEEPLTDPVPDDYHKDLRNYTMATSNEEKLEIWGRMQKLGEYLKDSSHHVVSGKPATAWSTYYMWAQSITMPWRYKNYYQ